MTIRFAPQAEADFAAVIGYIAERNPVAAQEFGERIFGLIDKLAAGESEGPEQMLTSGEFVRGWPVRVYYQRHASRSQRRASSYVFDFELRASSSFATSTNWRSAGELCARLG